MPILSISDISETFPNIRNKVLQKFLYLNIHCNQLVSGSMSLSIWDFDSSCWRDANISSTSGARIPSVFHWRTALCLYFMGKITLARVAAITNTKTYSNNFFHAKFPKSLSTYMESELVLNKRGIFSQTSGGDLLEFRLRQFCLFAGFIYDF